MAKPGERFGERLRDLRGRVGLTQSRLAERTGVSNTYICALESGRKPPPPHALVTALAACLGVDEETLWDLAQLEREARLRERIDGVPTSQRTRRSKAPTSSPPAADSDGDANLSRAMAALAAAIRDPKQHRSLAHALQTIADSLREGR